MQIQYMSSHMAFKHPDGVSKQKFPPRQCEYCQCKECDYKAVSKYVGSRVLCLFTCLRVAQYNRESSKKCLATFPEPFAKEGTLFAKGYPRIWDESREKRVEGYPGIH